MNGIFRFTVGVGLTALFVMAMSALRGKVVALELGTMGVGQLGVYLAAITAGVTVFAWGIGTSGAKLSSATESDADAGARARNAIMLLAVVLALVGTLSAIPILMVAKQAWALSGFAWPSQTAIAVAIGCSIISGAQISMLVGLRRLRSLVLAQLIGNTLGTAAGVTAVTLMGVAGLPFMVCTPAAATAVATSIATRSLYRLGRIWSRAAAVEVLRLGGPLTLALGLGALTQVGIRVWLSETQGLAIAGLYQAGVSIAAVYVTVLLKALATEFFPRLSRTTNPAIQNRQLDRQIEVSTSVGAAVAILAIPFAGVALRLLFSAEFEPAKSFLQLSLLGEVLKLPGWAIAFAFLARGLWRRYLFAEIVFQITFIGFTLAFFPILELKGIGLAYCFAYVVYALAAFHGAHRGLHFSLSERAARRIVLQVLAVILMAFLATDALAAPSGAIALVMMVGIALASTVYTLRVCLREED